MCKNCGGITADVMAWHGIGVTHADMRIYKHVCAQDKKQRMSSTDEISDKLPLTSMDNVLVVYHTKARPGENALTESCRLRRNDSYDNLQDYNEDIPAYCCMLCDAVFPVLCTRIRYACFLRCAQVAMHHNPASWQLSLRLHRRSHGNSKSTALSSDEGGNWLQLEQAKVSAMKHDRRFMLCANQKVLGRFMLAVLISRYQHGQVCGRERTVLQRPL